MHIHNIILIIVIAVGVVCYKYILPWASFAILKKKVDGLNRYMGRQVLHIEEEKIEERPPGCQNWDKDKDHYATCYYWDFDFATISEIDYKRMLLYCIRHNLKTAAEMLVKYTKIDLSDLEHL